MIADFFNNVPLMIMLTGALVGCAATLVGTFLVLRGNSMLSDAISHSIIFGIVIVWLITSQQSGPVQIVGAALTGVLTVFLIELLAGTGRVKNDAAIGRLPGPVLDRGALDQPLRARRSYRPAHRLARRDRLRLARHGGSRRR